MSWRQEYPRQLPERRPAGHRPRAPRWSAQYERPLSALTADYVGIQVADTKEAVAAGFFDLVERSMRADAASRPQAHEILTSAGSGEHIDVILLTYWTDAVQHARWFEQSELGRWFRALDPAAIGFGAWHESIQAPLDRVETIYSSPAREFGLLACPGIRIGPAVANGYFGAARDRLPISAIDSLDAPGNHARRSVVPSEGARLRASLGLNTAVIRSGQYWEEASGEQLDDYVTELEPKLMRGMNHLSDNRAATGTISLRVMRSRREHDLAPRRETSVLAYFHDLKDLEEWAARHATHAAIYEHAIAKNREYGDARTVITWHEVFVIAESSSFEYVNCYPTTGVLEFARDLWSVGHE